MSERSFEVQRFYFGVFGEGQKPTILARTADITGDQAAEVLQFARLEPPGTLSTEQMPASVGLFRGQHTHHIISMARLNAAGHPQILYLLLDAAPMSWLGGSLQPFEGLFYAEMPLFEKASSLKPLVLDDPSPADDDVQAEALQNLLLYCQDNMKAVEGIVTAFVEGKNIDITNAPADLEKRLAFVQGLVTMLPLPARTIMTFSTFVSRPEQSTAQVRFLAPGAKPSGDVLFDWSTAALSPANYERHDYARFMISQMRLDTALAVSHTQKLSRTASWRAIRRDNLSKALYWVSRRARIDASVQAGQPADRATVAGVLREDPTLTDELRVAYTRHLLSFTLVLEEWESADLIPGIAAGNKEVAQAVFRQLKESASTKDALDVYNLIEHWIQDVPEAGSLPWQQLLHAAALGHLKQSISAKDLKALVTFVYRLILAPPELKIDEIAPQVYEILLPGAHHIPALAQAYLLFGARFMVPGSFQELLADAEILPHLPDAQRKVIEHLQPEATKLKPLPKTLARAVAIVPPQYRNILMMRLVETALYMQRPWLIGDAELKIVAAISQSKDAHRYEHVIRFVADQFSDPEFLDRLSPPALQALPALYFVVGEIDAGVRLLEHLQNTVFTVERLSAVNDLVSQVFLNIKLDASQMLNVLAGFDGSKLRPEPRVRAYYAALMNLGWAREIDILAQQLVKMMNGDPRLMHLLGQDHVLRLLRSRVEKEDAAEALQLASAIVQFALQLGEAGPAFLLKAVKMLQWNNEVRAAMHELLRRYIRAIDPDRSRNLPAFFGRELGQDLEHALEATRLMRIITGGKDFVEFAQMIRVTRALLLDLCITYHENKVKPPIFRIVHDLQSMPATVTEEERQIMAANILEIAQLAMQTGSQASKGINPEPGRTISLSFRSVLKEAREAAPTTPPEFLSWLGLNFSDTFVTELGLERKEPAHIFGNRSISVLYQETLWAYQLLYRLSIAFPEENPPRFQLSALKAEIDSLWHHVSPQHQQRILQVFAEDTQKVGLLLTYIADHNRGTKALGDRAIGKQLEEGKRQPTLEIEALRFISGYFARKQGR